MHDLDRRSASGGSRKLVALVLVRAPVLVAVLLVAVSVAILVVLAAIVVTLALIVFLLELVQLARLDWWFDEDGPPRSRRRASVERCCSGSDGRKQRREGRSRG